MRSVFSLNKGWLFKRGESNPINPDDSFERIDVPHTWNNTDGQDGGDDYYRGYGLYVKTFPRPLEEDTGIPSGERVFLEFNGVGQSATVYLNGKLVGEHKGGYSIFRFEITDYIDDENVLQVVADNTINELVYPQTADFTFYGGIYRDVCLITTGASHFELIKDGSKGIKITPRLNGESATVDVELFAVGGDSVRVEIAGQLACADVIDGRAVVSVDIEEPHLWDGKNDPFLYACEAYLIDGGKEVDEVASRFGIREFHMDPDKGFFLNGKSYPLRGVAKHQDRAAVGNAISRENMEEDMALIMELGATTVRLAHYQHDQYFYDLCDMTGMIVWAEIPFISRFMPDAVDNTVSQMRELITQNYNHPSIVCWGLSNEITIGGDAEDPALLNNHRMLNDLAHRMDDTRPTTMAHVFVLDTNASLIDLPDIASYNLYYGWYLGELKENEEFLDKFHREHPSHIMGLSEYGADANPKYHSSSPRKGDYTEEYQCVYHEHLVKMITERPYLWATHVWNMFDFAADARKEGGNHGKNQKGLVTIDRKLKKDSFYLYKAFWNNEEPFVRLCGRRYVDRNEEETLVKVYSNQPEVSLYVDGELVDTKKSDRIFEFMVPISGEHTIKAVSGVLTDEINIRYVSEPNKDYVVEGKDVINWFEAEDLDPTCFSINDSMESIMANPEAGAIVGQLMERARAARGDIAERAMQNEQLQKIMGKMSLQTLLTMSSDVSHEEIKELNKILQKIKK